METIPLTMGSGRSYSALNVKWDALSLLRRGVSKVIVSAPIAGPRRGSRHSPRSMGFRSLPMVTRAAPFSLSSRRVAAKLWQGNSLMTKNQRVKALQAHRERERAKKAESLTVKGYPYSHNPYIAHEPVEDCYAGCVRAQETKPMKMSTDHLKRCQEIAELTGGKELAKALACAIARRKEVK